jgi:tetratricopeptide (TPR) repeat protein
VGLSTVWHIDWLDEAEKQLYLLKIIPALRQYWTNRGFGEQVIKILDPAIHNPEHPASLRARGMVELAAIMTTMAQQERASLLCQEAIETAPENVYVQVLALQTLARIAIQRGKFEEAQALLERVAQMETLRNSSDDAQIDLLFAGNHIGQGLIAGDTGNNALARYHYKIAIASFTRLNEPLRLADVNNNLGLLLMREGDYEAAKHYFDETLSMAQVAAYDPLITIALQNLGTVLMHIGDFAKAIKYIIEALEVSMKIKRMQSILGQLETLTHIAYLIQEYPIAIQLHGFGKTFMEQHNLTLVQGTIEVVQRYVEDMQQSLAEDFDLYYRLGESLSLDAAVRLSEELLVKLEERDNSNAI